MRAYQAGAGKLAVGHWIEVEDAGARSERRELQAVNSANRRHWCSRYAGLAAMLTSTPW